MKIGDEVYIHGYIDEIRHDTVIIKNDGGYFGTVEPEIVLTQIEPCEDCISRQAAIDALADMHCKSDENGYVWIIRSDAWARIDALPSAQPEQKWIPCSERLPEQYGNYLVSYRTDDFESDIGTFDPDRINSDTGEWSACDANGFYWVASKGLEVIAWMPLPEPYKERREEGDLK